MLTCLPGYDSQNPGWLITKRGEILGAADDSPQRRPLHRNDHSSYDSLSYEARNAAGKVGCE
jgi:hypothetical protein